MEPDPVETGVGSAALSRLPAITSTPSELGAESMIDYVAAYPNSRKVVETRTATLTPHGDAVRFVEA